MLVGIWMSFVKLTKFFIANWSAAPWAGFDNYRVAVDFDDAVGEGLLKSFGVTVAFSLITVALSWGLGMAAAVALQPPFKGRSLVRTLFLVPYALPAYAGDPDLELHAPARHRRGEPRAGRQPRPGRRTGRSG